MGKNQRNRQARAAAKKRKAANALKHGAKGQPPKATAKPHPAFAPALPILAVPNHPTYPGAQRNTAQQFMAQMVNPFAYAEAMSDPAIVFHQVAELTPSEPAVVPLTEEEQRLRAAPEVFKAIVAHCNRLTPRDATTDGA